MAEKSFRSEDDNVLPNCVELVASDAQGSEPDEVVYVAELRLGTARHDFGSYSANIALKKCELAIEIAGGAIRRGSRLGDLLRKPTDEQKSKLKTAATSESSIEGQITVTPTSPKASIKAKRSNKTSETKTTDHVVTTPNVIAKGGNTWEFFPPANHEVMSGAYLRDDALCIIQAAGDSKEIASIQSVVRARKSDISISDIADNVTGKTKLLSVNRTKILSLLAAQAIDTPGDYIVFSRSTTKRRK